MPTQTELIDSLHATSALEAANGNDAAAEICQDAAEALHTAALEDLEFAIDVLLAHCPVPNCKVCAAVRANLMPDNE